MVAVLDVLVLAGSGIAAGVLFCVALSVVPAFLGMEPAQYVAAHRLIGKNYDPVMPLTVLGTVVADAVLAVVRSSVPFGLAAVLLLGVSAVSHLANVPINRLVKSLDTVPSTWDDPRPRWRNWNLLRTGLAIAALLVNAIAVVATG
ncbi:anthrone oxygenase family protein [Amycolatopsis sp. NPDC051758]|uniref:anthrone oxygenase family protein n=1 Tax=Amycolatopsis sp. NPDC051758 TaxID=3363935 RepID=UPI0037A20BEB